MVLASNDSSIYDVLKQHGLPMGLLPKGISNFSLDSSGNFEVNLDRACNAKFENELHYDRNISGTLRFGRIDGLTGVTAQDLFLWFPVIEIRVDIPSSGLIYFDVGVVSKQFSLSSFETPRDCLAGPGPDLRDGRHVVETVSKVDFLILLRIRGVNRSSETLFKLDLNFTKLEIVLEIGLTDKRTRISRNYKTSGGGSFSAVACSTSSPLFGKVGLHKREGNFSLLSFGVDPIRGAVEFEEKSDASQVLSALLPFVVALTAVAALSQPSTFTWVSKDLYAPALGGIMLSIGIKLSIDDFALAFKRPLPLSIGFIAQYMVKPALGVLVARAFGMSPMFYTGFVLMSCVAGAQLSSYASFLSKGDVALSILLTSSSTIASVLITPLLTGLLIGSVVPVDAIAMSKSILQVVLAPVALGLVLNTYAKPIVSILQPLMPFVAMICTSMCIGSPLAINRSQILSAEGLKLVGPVLSFHALAFTLGYWISKIQPLRQVSF
ncbi:hypothetical protein RD792_010167 [Penstemon davidsonii]|uniref:Sodium/metabolite cotransporter BASS3, chloroplastic n=1 Tax=Penstemon davidsonii TaxID=160366 RepID=A0ABR0D2W8_9LAMI|nr:hypothetical protein RD792_010167 [Penstemon davidsonii]